MLSAGRRPPEGVWTANDTMQPGGRDEKKLRQALQGHAAEANADKQTHTRAARRA